MLLDPADRGFVQHDNMSIAFIPKAQHCVMNPMYDAGCLNLNILLALSTQEDLFFDVPKSCYV